MKNSLKKLLILICVFVLSSSTFAQIKVINNKGTFFQVDTSKWSLVGVDIFNKNQIGNVGVGTFPYNARFVVDNGNSAILPVFKLKYPFTGAVSDSILTWNSADSTVRKVTLLNLLTGNTIRSLNGLTGSTQTFATGTDGTDFNISSSGSTHTFNIPNATSTNRGFISAADWITFNNKIGAVTATTAAAVNTALNIATIQNTGAYWNANQLQGRNISTTAPTDGQVLTWNDTTSQWVPTSSTLTSSNGIDIGYIVAWGSNTTPPDYLLPLSGGTYNWADFPHFQAFQATHPSQFITNNGTTFTLKDINTSGRFLRGGLTVNVDQNGSTAMPINPFVLNNYTHSHNYINTSYTFTNYSYDYTNYYNHVNAIQSYSQTNTNTLTNDDTHSHTLSGGDSETRPVNTSVIWCIKVKPTMTAGNITINTGATTTTVSNSIVGNELTTTVNGVPSTPVTLPTPEPAVVEIYDAAGTQTLTTSFANLTFGTTNIADAGYTIGGSGSQITISDAGTYRITYRVTAKVTSNQGTEGEYQLTKNGTTVLPGTLSNSTHINTDRDKNTVTVVKIVVLTAGDIISVQGRRSSVVGTLQLSANGSSLIIERIK